MIAIQDGERVVRVVVGIQVFASMITQGSEIGVDHVVRCVNGLPEGATYVRGWVDELALCICLLFTHPSFDAVARGDVVPMLDIVLSKAAPTCQEERDAGA